jgi:hypothetical protein
MTGKAEEYQEALQQKQAPGYGALGVMEQHLANHAFFTGDRYTIADIGLFAYTYFAGEGGFELTRFPAIQSWINRGKKSTSISQYNKIKLKLNEAKYIAVIKKVRYALCPMPYALCPIVPHVTEKGYTIRLEDYRHLSQLSKVISAAP